MFNKKPCASIDAEAGAVAPLSKKEEVVRERSSRTESLKQSKLLPTSEKSKELDARKR
jgi:hypothetical protein